MGRRHEVRTIGRRKLLKGAVALGAALPASTMLFPKPAISQGATKFNFSLAWLPEGGSNFVYVSKYKDFWMKHGLDVEISRGYGSVATAKAVASGQFPMAFCAYGAALLSVMKGLDLKLISTVAYNSTMGVAVPADGPIKKPKDLEGKKIGIVPTSGEAPYFPAYMTLEKIDESKVTKVALDVKVLEQSMIQGRVDAITMFALSSTPVFVSQKFATKNMLYSTAGLDFYNLSVIAKPDYIEKIATYARGSWTVCIRASSTRCCIQTRPLTYI